MLAAVNNRPHAEEHAVGVRLEARTISILQYA
jgi:hypothetical protein